MNKVHSLFVALVCLLLVLYTPLPSWAQASPYGTPKYPQKPKEEKKKIPADPVLSSTKIKERYRVDILAAVYLDEMVQNGKSIYANKIADKSLPGLQFYEGVKLAVDALNDEHYNVDVHFHDVGSASTSLTTLIGKQELENSDLIIGYIQGSDLKIAAAFAEAKKINFISALSPSDAGIVGNPYFTLLQPMLKTHCKFISNAVLSKHTGTIPVLTRPAVALDKAATDYITALNAGRYMPLSVSGTPDLAKLATYFDSTRNNAVVISIMDANEADKILKMLSESFSAYAFEVFGMPSWKTLSSFKKEEAYPNLHIHYSAPFYFDPTTGPGTTLVSNYKKTFGSTRPGDMVYRGYETTYWFTYLLNKYGTVFNTYVNDNAAASFTRFDLQAVRNDEGAYLFVENQHLYLFRYSNGSFTVE